MRGGYSGTPAIVDRDSAASRLIHIVAGLEENLIMPPAGGQLSAEEIGVLRAWIDQGTPFAAERFDDSTRKDEQPWLHMDYGPVISAAVTVREPEDPRADKGPGDNISYKAHAILLDAKRESGVIFDTELLRMAAGWTNGPLVLTGTVYDWKARPAPLPCRGAGIRDADGSGLGPRRQLRRPARRRLRPAAGRLGPSTAASTDTATRSS